MRHRKEFFPARLRVFAGSSNCQLRICDPGSGGRYVDLYVIKAPFYMSSISFLGYNRSPQWIGEYVWMFITG
jgi:hypothetical protein